MTKKPQPLSILEDKEEFTRRHIGPREGDIVAMLKTLGQPSLEALGDAVLPSSIKDSDLSGLPAAKNEHDMLKYLRGVMAQNTHVRSFIGQGYYGTVLPPVILRNVLENPGWYTAYTPYQPEISQGRLEAMLNFQQMVIDLTGMDIANASMLDEATAAAEAMTLARRTSKAKSNRFIVVNCCHPQTIDVVRTRAEPLGIEVLVAQTAEDFEKDCFGLLVQYPNTYGRINDFEALAKSAHDKGALVIAATDLLALTLIKPPGEWGADIVVGSAQRFGVPPGFGGPHAAFFATKQELQRSVPGRIVGVSVDKNGKPALRLALQTREQHIRREKATSNICTAQVLLANIAGFYAVWHGPEGLKKIARRVHRLTSILAAGLIKAGFKILNDSHFDTLTVETTDKAVAVRAKELGINLNFRLEGKVFLSLDEKTTRTDVEDILYIFSGKREKLNEDVTDAIPENFARKSDFLTHAVFNRYHSETEMLRYLSRLERKDIALNRSMIPLGSCTMKLNATAEMIPVTWPEVADIHPFAPAEQVKGYRQMIGELEDMLCAITGFAAVSLQPNAGSQGEYAGLLAIEKYHADRGQGHRKTCLIPASAHGTNPATASMVGMKIVVVKCDDKGNVDIDDLREKAQAHKDDLAALMITYPSTHGVFEEGIVDICRIIHDNGGQVYMDGANLNAMVGLAKPGKFGADVMHMNLHKTFCIPHGGGGPGVGPIGVAAHLAPYLPGKGKTGAVSAAPYGSASILPISWAYIAMMGAAGLKKATQVAILNANYIARKLSAHYPVLYTGKNGLVAHECIIDTRPLKAIGIEVDDIAKRLMDYGFHAPTMSFPVPGTLMIEPTESESKAELDRFCDAMIAIREEIRNVEKGVWSKDDNPLVNAPHSMHDVLAESWVRAYDRKTAAFPAEFVAADKYWPPVSRIDQVYGDRNLVCTCPPMEIYEDAA